METDSNAIVGQKMSERRQRPRPVGAPVLSFAELEEVRLILRGGSAVDWYRLNFSEEEEARAFLRLLELEPDDQETQTYGAALVQRAAHYLEEEHGYRVPSELLEGEPISLFMYASEKRGRRRDRFFACSILKVMHIMHHIAARELRYRLPLSQSVLATMLLHKVHGFAESLRSAGFPLVEYIGNEKSFASRVTKLLVKHEHHAATIHDRVRFRFVVETSADIVPLLRRMSRELIPFNYVVPGETLNHLVNFTALVEGRKAYREQAGEFQVEIGHEDAPDGRLNEFSGRSYRVVNFVADVPLQVPPKVLDQVPRVERSAHVIFGLAEFQIVDVETADENARGENSHQKYKARQLAQVRDRIERGLRGVRIDEL